jgi:hypothetical protein
MSEATDALLALRPKVVFATSQHHTAYRCARMLIDGVPTKRYYIRGIIDCRWAWRRSVRLRHEADNADREVALPPMEDAETGRAARKRPDRQLSLRDSAKPSASKVHSAFSIAATVNRGLPLTLSLAALPPFGRSSPIPMGRRVATGTSGRAAGKWPSPPIGPRLAGMGGAGVDDPPKPFDRRRVIVAEEAP